LLRKERSNLFDFLSNVGHRTKDRLIAERRFGRQVFSGNPGARVRGARGKAAGSNPSAAFPLHTRAFARAKKYLPARAGLLRYPIIGYSGLAVTERRRAFASKRHA
jgi:hypothetical protein